MADRSSDTLRGFGIERQDRCDDRRFERTGESESSHGWNRCEDRRAVETSRGAAETNPTIHPSLNDQTFVRSLPLRSTELVRTVEEAVIPRLHMVLQDAPRLRASAARVPTLPITPSPDEIDSFARLVATGNHAACRQSVDQLRNRGMTHEAILLTLLAPAARRLGDMWDEDSCDFNDVTIGVMLMQTIVRQSGPELRAAASSGLYSSAAVGRRGGGTATRALVLPMPGEQHLFGCLMIETFFAQAGFDVTGWPLPQDLDVVDLVASAYYDIIGLSVGCQSNLPLLAPKIRAIRTASRNPDLIVMAGGSAFAANPQLALDAGADATGADGPMAVKAALAQLSART
jgi:MerR family transcriptional regulator, light-induced transcriptional regulator